MDVGRTTEVPDHGGSFDLPDIPDAVVSDVVVFEEGKMEIIEAVILDELESLIDILLAERRQQVCHDLVHMFLLVAGQFADRDAL